MAKLADLLEKRAKIVDRMKAAHTANNGEDFTTAETELRALDGEIARTRALEQAERGEAGTPIGGGDVDLSREVRSRFSLGRLIASQFDPTVDAGFEREVQPDLAKRAGRSAKGVFVPMELFERRAVTTANGGDLISTDHRPDLFINALAAASMVRMMGATVLTGLVGDVSIPKETDAPNVGWVAEDSAIPGTDGTFGSVTLSPKHAGALCQWSRNMVLQSSPQVEQLMRMMMARDLGLAIDRAAIRGGGANEPTGILATAGVLDQAFATDYIITSAEMIGKADVANVGAMRGFLGTPGIRTDALKKKDTQGRPIAIAEQFHGEPIQFSTQVPSDLGVDDDEHGLIYGDWTELLIGMWSEIDILVNPFEATAFAKGGVAIRAMASVDVALRHDEAFVQATGITPA